MNILYDYQIFQLQRFGGISNCFVQLIKNLPSRIQFEIGIKDSENVHLLESGLTKVRPLHNFNNFICQKSFKGKGRLYNLASNLLPQINSINYNLRTSVNLLKKGEFDVFHPTYFDPYFLPYLAGKPFVLTIHDMTPELFPGLDDWQIERKMLLAEKANHIIAVSKKTKDDIIEILKVPENKISVIYHGQPEKNINNYHRLIEKPYLLYVGARYSYKNFIPMIKALYETFQKHPELSLVCTGPDFNTEELDILKKQGIIDRIHHIFASDNELMSLYHYAEAFIYPSLYEGFGIPILEAYQNDCPVFLNRKSCFPEIAGDAAVYFELDEQNNTLSTALENFLQKEDCSAKLIEKQKERLSYFSWKKSAQDLAEVYEKVIKENN